LRRVRTVQRLLRVDAKKPAEHKQKIGAGDLMKVLLFLGQKPLKSEVALIIWVSLSMSTMCV